MKHRIQFTLFLLSAALLLTGCATVEGTTYADRETADNITAVLNMCTLLSGN